MTVSELIDLLEECDPHTEVLVRSIEDGLVVQTSDLTGIRFEGRIDGTVIEDGLVVQTSDLTGVRFEGRIDGTVIVIGELS